MTKKANKDLLHAVIEPEAKGAMQQIADACAAGADPNSFCPECSSSTGPVREGSTLLTHAIQDWSSKVVEKLLECGADPSLVDRNGWTPWAASTLIGEPDQKKIQDALSRHGAKKDGEHIGKLARAISNGNVDQVKSLIESDADFVVLSSFRVDLVGHQISSHNAEMLELLLEHGMTPSSTNRLNSIRGRSLSCLDVLLHFGMAPEDPGDSETPLMTAAAMGELKIVQRLVEAGADVNRYSDKKKEWTASFYARRAGKTEVANWLDSCMNEEIVDAQDRIKALRDSKFQLLHKYATAGEGLSTDAIVETLQRWDDAYGITVKNANTDSVVIMFSSLPENLDVFCDELLSFCPDVCEDIQALTNELTKQKTLGLWWD